MDKKSPEYVFDQNKHIIRLQNQQKGHSREPLVNLASKDNVCYCPKGRCRNEPQTSITIFTIVSSADFYPGLGVFELMIQINGTTRYVLVQLIGLPRKKLTQRRVRGQVSLSLSTT